MNNRDKTFVQKLKDNAFYVALGLGLLAILAVVAVYTLERNGEQLARNEVDLNKASDYSVIVTEKEKVEETNGKTANQSGKEERNTLREDLTAEAREDNTSSVEDKDSTDVTKDTVSTKSDNEKAEATKNQEESATEREYPLPVVADAGELNFTSDKTLTWPVEGKVILPYSMETTIYYKTLEQYQCNPGILISAGNGTTVKNAFLGKVTKVTSDNVYGNTVTLYLGNDYSIVYGQLDTIYVKEGDFVKEGESIGTIGNPTDSFAKEGSHLFFQMFQGEEPVDPMLFIE